MAGVGILLIIGIVGFLGFLIMWLILLVEDGFEDAKSYIIGFAVWFFAIYAFCGLNKKNNCFSYKKNGGSSG